VLDILLLCTILVVGFALFASEKVRVDLVALGILAVLTTLGLFRPAFPTLDEGVSGFSDSATLTIAAMFVLSSSLTRTGAIGWVSEHISRIAGGGEIRLFIVLMTVVGVISAFINNTAAVAIFLPIAISFAREHEISPSRLLMPLSFASIVGGTCTLIGTSTNILVSSLAVRNGLEEFSMFELTKLGAVFLVVGLSYLVLVGRRLLPDRPDTTLTRKYKLARYLTGLIVNEGSSLHGQSAAGARLSELYDVTVLEIIRGDERIWTGVRDARMREGDHLLVRGALDGILEMRREVGVGIRSEAQFAEADLTTGESTLVDGIISPSSSLVGQSLIEADFRNRTGVFALAIRKHGETIRDKVGRIRLDVGDTLLLQGLPDSVKHLEDRPFSLVLQELDIEDRRDSKAFVALAIVAAVVALAATGIVPILLGAILGSLAMIATGCLKVQEAYEAIDWFVVFLLAGMIPLGIAMERTGTAELIASGILDVTSAWGPAAVLSAFYLLTTVFSAVMSHNAAAVVLVPIGIAAAQALGVDARPFLVAITFAASSSLATPFGYHTNLMVYTPGGYAFSDYLKVGIPLNLIFWVIASFLIPIFWPLH
jgi:di/tricarboxylate transporter